MNLQEVQREYDQAVTEAQGLISRNADPGTTRTALERVKSLKGRLSELRTQNNLQAEIERRTARMTGGHDVRGNSPGAQFVRATSDWFKDHGYTRDVSWASPTIEIQAATITSDPASGGAVVAPDYRPTIVPQPIPPPSVADLLSDGDTTSNAVSYPSEKTFTNAAAPTAEGAVKPESTLIFETKSDKVEKIAHWIPVTEELLEDAPALRSYIDARLTLGVQLVEDDQLLNGNGIAPNLLGLLNRAGLHPDQPRGTDSNADAVAKQIAAIAADTGMVPTGIVMHPTNFTTTQLAKDSAGNYIGGAGPFAAPGAPRLWGLPVAVTKAIAVGTALVVTRSAAMVLKRSPLSLAATNSHADYFIRNLIAIRAEQRETLAVFIPAGFGKITGLN